MTAGTTNGTSAPRSPLRVYGRGAEAGAVEALTARLADGVGGALVLSARPGLGRSTLLAHAAARFASRGAGLVLHTRATPAESALPYAGLHALLCGAPPQARATPPTDVLRAGVGAAAFVEEAAFLEELRAMAAGAPLLVCVDDVHLWDRESRTALGFAARRAGPAYPVGVLVTTEQVYAGEPDFAAVPGLRIPPLAAEAAGALLDELVPVGAVADVRERLLRAAGGNPRLLADLVALLTGRQLTGADPLPYPLPVERALLRGYAARLRALPYGTGLVLGLAAAAAELAADPEAGPEPEPECGPERGTERGPGAELRRGPGESGDPRDSGGPDAPDGPGEGGAGADADLVLRAARSAGLGPAALGPAEMAGLIRTAEGRIRFDPPLLARAVYAGEPLARRQAAHALLASALHGERNRLSRLRHEAAAVTGPAPALADALAEAVEAAVAGNTAAGGTAPRAPYGHRAVAGALARAAELSEDDDTRVARFTAAADHARLAGASRTARGLLGRARGLPARRAVRGRAELVRGVLELRDGPVADAREALLLAAGLLAPQEPGFALDAVLGAADAAWAAGDVPAYLAALDRTGGLDARGGLDPTGGPDRTVDRPAALDPRRPAVRTATGTATTRTATARTTTSRTATTRTAVARTAGTPAPLVHYCAGMAAVMRGRFTAARPPLHRVLELAAGRSEPADLIRASAAALVLGEVAAAREAAARALASARAHGHVTLVPQALEYLAYSELRSGLHARAREHARAGLRAAQRTGQRNSAAHHHAILAMAASVEGTARDCAAHASAAARTAAQHGLVMVEALTVWALARAALAEGRPQEAAARLGPLVRPGPRRGHHAVRMLAVPCFIEAATRGGAATRNGAEDTDADVRTALVEFTDWAGWTADPNAPGQLERCRALLAGPQAAGALYARAVARHERASGEFERARTQLLHGKELRRRRRLLAAREQLRDALIGFERCGARSWAAQARAELRATGETTGAGETAEDTSGEAAPPGGAAENAQPLRALTPQQLRIARCVADGATNREVAVRLSVSPRTVDHHLRNIFATLGVRSRVELARLVDRAARRQES
ncbi:helix-turn-helix transcriptional regulator [Streptomyces armeniacus]|uniref:Helix-turn-helix transcriptional regulator n=2 Tax=Streptomyces armeniacus TaxID=83291 RepID=A0A345XM16_9ACTN|nr:helix-turn-helix transcriptional regulator [Streptomyces armeniacus]